MESQDCTWT